MRVAEWLWRTWWEQTWCGQRRSTAAELTAWPILHTGRHNKRCSLICAGITWRFYLDPSPLQHPHAGLRQWWLFPGRSELWTTTSVSPHINPPVFSPASTNTKPVIVCRLRDRRHQDFVNDVCWLQGGSDTLTTVGWDHLVLHHTVGTANGAPHSSV